MKRLNRFSTRLKLISGALLCLCAFLLLARGEIRHAVTRAVTTLTAPRSAIVTYRAAPTAVVRPQTGGGFTLPQSVTAGGGGESSGGTFQLQSTSGQALTGVSSGGAFTVESGFWPGGANGVNCPAIALAPATLANPFIGQPYSQTLTASGGAAPYTFSSSNLPVGLTLSGGGVLSGTLTQYGTFNFSITATDANSCTGPRAYSLNVVCPALTLGPPALPAGNPGLAYSANLNVTGGTGPFTFAQTDGTLPPGLTLSGAGVLGGTPAITGTFLFGVRVFDFYECGTERQYAVTITCPTITVNPPTLPNKTVGQVVTSLSVSASGGTAPHSFALTGGALPTGLTLAANGAITGTVTAAPGPYSFTITATDARGCAGSRFYSITVNPAACPLITVSPNSPLNATVGVAYSQMLNGSGGTMPYTFAVTTGSLPPNLSLSNAGLLSGTLTTLGTYNFTVTATDANNCQGSTAYTFNVNCPTIMVEPAALPNKTVGQVVTTLSVTGAGGLAPYSFALTGGALPTGLTLASNGAITGTVTAAPGPFSFTITTTDARGCTGSRFYAITVNPPVCPAITLAPTTLAAATAGVAYSQSISAAGGVAPYNFSLSQGGLPAGLTLTAGGLLAGTPSVTGSFNFTVTARDANGCQGSTAYSFVVNCPTITVNPATLPDKTVGQVVTTLGVTGFGGLAPYSFALTSGALPTGLTLAADGTISGTVVAAPGPFSFTITATDARGCAGSRFYSITVNPLVCPALTVGPATLPAATFGVAYSQTHTASGGAAPYSFMLSNGNLPPGMTLAANGQWSGTPSAVGSFPFTVTVTAANGCQGSAAYTFVVNCPTLTVNPAALPGGALNAAYNQALTASGGSGPATFSVSSGVLPNGLSLSGAGVLAGTPSQLGSFSFTVRAANSNGCFGEQAYTLAVACPAITLTPGTGPGGNASLPNGVVNTAYNQTVTAQPAGGNYSYAVTTNILPPGLTLNSTTGAITGIPTAGGNYTFAITATGFGGCAARQAYNLLVTATCAPITLNPATLPGGTLGTAYSQTVSATGGSAPYTFSVLSGALPTGLTLDAATGALSGTPQAGGAFAFTLKAAGVGGCFGTRQYVVSIACAALTFSPATLPNGTVSAPYNQSLTVGAGGPATFSLLLGQLPVGFNLSGAGVISGVANQTGAFNFTVKALAGSCQSTKAYTLVIGTAARLAGLAGAQLADYDGDGKSDLALWASATGAWRIVRSGNQQTTTQTWGAAGDLTLLGDYDGDGKTDLAVFRPSEGTFYAKRSSDGGVLTKAWGLGTDVPVPGDYDGDGKTDIAVWRGSDSNWYIVRSSDGMIETVAWGASYAPYLDVAVPGDYDGDGKTDVAVFRRATGTWFIKRSSDGQVTVKAWGLGTDVPVAADYDGDGKTDIAVWRSGTWYIWQSASNNAREVVWGANYAPYHDQAAPGDYDGDGKADVVVWRAAEQTWYLRCSADSHVLTQPQGQAGDAPVARK